MPHMVDLAHFPEVRAVLEPQEKKHTFDDLWATFEPIFPAMLARWKADTERQFFKRLKYQVRLPKGIKPSELAVVASAIVKCSRCKERRVGLSAIYHRCCNTPWNSIGKVVQSYDTRPEAIFKVNRWTCDIFDTVYGDRVEAIFRSIGNEDLRATCQELDEQDVRLICKLCQPHDGMVPVMKWRTAVSPHHCILRTLH